MRDVPRRWRRGLRVPVKDCPLAIPSIALEKTPKSALLRRLLPPAYGDSVSSLGGVDRPSPRAVSNAVCAQGAPEPNTLGASDFLWQWGQFIDHDIDLTENADPAEPAPIPVPTGDPQFDPTSSGTATIGFNRSAYAPGSGTRQSNPRQQVNQITGPIDGSAVYGSGLDRQLALRTLDGTGRLKTSAGDLLPFNVDGLPNAGGTGPTLFLAGDIRANEQVALIAMHTLFVREHNRLVDEAKVAHPTWTDDQLFEYGRSMVAALMQAITYNEYLPALLGTALPPFSYDAGLDGRVTNEFSTACYRWGHSALSPTLLRLEAGGASIPQGPLALRDAFFSPSRVTDEGGIEPILRGLATQPCQRVDCRIVDDVRNFLFGPPGAGGFDLASLNIQRGRDHGLPSYNDVREWQGDPRATTFADVTSDGALQAALASVYATPDDIDLWVGALAEDPQPGSHLGPLNHTLVAWQFQVLRNSDANWYERALPQATVQAITNTRLSDVIRRNTPIAGEIQDNVFAVPVAP